MVLQVRAGRETKQYALFSFKTVPGGLLMIQRSMKLIVGLCIIAGSNAANRSLQRPAALHSMHKICPEDQW
jgi:hypothetical protein